MLRARRIVAPSESQHDRMMDVSFFVAAMAVATFLLAGLVKGVIGLGLPSIAIGLLALVMTPAQAAAIMVVPTFVTNVWQMLVGPHLVTLVRRMWLLLVGSVVGIWLAAAFSQAPIRASRPAGSALPWWCMRRSGLPRCNFQCRVGTNPGSLR